MEEDQQSISGRSDARSELTQSSDPFTQEEVDALRGYLASHGELVDLQKKTRDARKELQKHKEVLIEMLSKRKKTKVRVGEMKLHLMTKTVVKKPNASKIFTIIENSLKSDDTTREAYGRIEQTIQRSLKDSQEQKEKRDLVLDDGKKKKRAQRDDA